MREIHHGYSLCHCHCHVSLSLENDRIHKRGFEKTLARQMWCEKYRVFFLTGPTQKSSKYGTGPPQYRKMTKFTGDGKNPLLKK